MRFSLIVATIHRTTELQRLLASLERQTHHDFEVIVVDQNTDDRLLPILKTFEDRLNIRRTESSPGLSRARNVGLRVATGAVICFPDDDCWYTEDLLLRIDQLFTTNPGWGGIIGESVDEFGKPNLPWRDRAGTVSEPKCWRRAISYALFVRATLNEQVRGFDPVLGVGSGSPWGSGEDNDFMLRALKAGFHIHYEREVRVSHPHLFPNFDQKGCEKRLSYACGDGKLLQKHPMPLWWQLLFFSIPLFRAALSTLKLDRDETYFHWLTFEGRVTGFLSSEVPGAGGLSLTFEIEGARDRSSSLSALKALSAAAGTE